MHDPDTRTGAAVAAATESPEGDSIERVIETNERQRRPSSRLQSFVDRASDGAGRPGFVLVLAALPTAWIGYNLIAGQSGLLVLDVPPFAWLELIVTLIGLLLAAIIIATQRREDRLAERRAKLTLELAVLAERKSAKIIQLLEEIRRDSPQLADRFDAESETMSTPSDPDTLLKRIDNDTPGTPSA